MNLKYFFLCKYYTLKFVYVVVPPVVEALFCNILKIICHINFKCGSINFHKKGKQLARHQHQNIVSFILNIFTIFIYCFYCQLYTCNYQQEKLPKIKKISRNNWRGIFLSVIVNT